MSELSKAGAASSLATNPRQVTGVHYSHGLGQPTESMSKHNEASLATDPGQATGVHYSHQLG